MIGEQAAVEYLRREPLWHMDMLEALARGQGQVVHHEGRTVLVARREASGFYLLTADGPEAALKALANRPAPWIVVARGPGVAEAVAARWGLETTSPCVNAAYLRGERLSWDCPGLVIRPFRLAELPVFLAHYHIEGEAEAREHIRRGELFAAEYHGQLAGFMGLHGDGSMGMLETFPAYRRLGIGRALEKHLINFCLDKGWIPYGQVFLDNEASFSLQQHLGLAVDRTKAIWWCLSSDE